MTKVLNANKNILFLTSQKLLSAVKAVGGISLLLVDEPLPEKLRNYNSYASEWSNHTFIPDGEFIEVNQ